MLAGLATSFALALDLRHHFAAVGDGARSLETGEDLIRRLILTHALSLLAHFVTLPLCSESFLRMIEINIIKLSY